MTPKLTDTIMLIKALLFSEWSSRLDGANNA